ncbi:hypothetical protein B0H13DRAFT_1918570 [Mycena leptocephala]|nr:hypothetical protein B0H13DRAFT_1918570 [Mycena leptocephala]
MAVAFRLRSISPLIQDDKKKPPTSEEILEHGLKVKEYELRHGNFSETGEFSFGMQEHIDLGARTTPALVSSSQTSTSLNRHDLEAIIHSPASCQADIWMVTGAILPFCGPARMPILTETCS